MSYSYASRTQRVLLPQTAWYCSSNPMARPRVFVSSTFYDLKYVRADLERFIRDLGYDPVLHERGSVPYGSKEKLEAYCYREIQQVELLVSVVGGRFGSPSENQPYSISQQELKTAYELGVQVFVFVEAPVLSEYQTYLRNKDVTEASLKYAHVDDVRIYRFLEELHALPNNNPITPFGSVQEIINFLRDQWAGMFQRFLQNEERQREYQLVKDLQANMQTLNQLVTYLTKEKQNSDQAIRDILTANHPVFAQLRKLLGVKYRVFFTNKAEFVTWIRERGYSNVKPTSWDDSEVEEWIRERSTPSKLLKIAWKKVFDGSDNLIIYTPQQWDESWITLNDYWPIPDIPPEEVEPVPITDDDIPF